MVEIGEADLDALLYAYRQDMAADRTHTSTFPEWLSGLLWEQANAIRHGLGAHTAWRALRKASLSEAR